MAEQIETSHRSKPQASPLVSICTLTHNRPIHLKKLQTCIEAQNYPLEKIEWVILDDSNIYKESLEIKSSTEIRIKYQRLKEKLPLGRKRNLSHKLCSGEVIVYMDDDDYYFPERISHAVETLQKSTGEIAGSTTLHIYFRHDDSLWISGPFGAKHATAGTFAMTRRFALGNTYDNAANCNEEKSFLRNYTLPIAQLNPLKTMVCISHQSNTFDKKRMRSSGATARMKPAPEQESERILKLLSQSGHRPKATQATTRQAKPLQRIALISGPWGSGTTALCQLTAKLGINTPGPYFQTNDPRTQNSYEMLAFNRLITKCVKEETLTKKLPDTEIQKLITAFSHRQELKSENKLTALKTPACSALLRELSESFNLQLIICLRDYTEIEASRARRGWPAHFGMEGARKIYGQINEFIANTNTPFLFVRHSDLTNQKTIGQTVNEIIRFLNIHPTTESIDSAIASIRTQYSVIQKPLT